MAHWLFLEIDCLLLHRAQSDSYLFVLFLHIDCCIDCWTLDLETPLNQLTNESSLLIPLIRAHFECFILADRQSSDVDFWIKIAVADKLKDQCLLILANHSSGSDNVCLSKNDKLSSRLFFAIGLYYCTLPCQKYVSRRTKWPFFLRHLSCAFTQYFELFHFTYLKHAWLSEDPFLQLLNLVHC